jgi:hypothetical protein
MGLKPHAAREKLVQESLQVVFVRVLKQPAALEEPSRAEPGLLAGLLEGLGLRLVPIGRVQQLVFEGGDRRRTFEALQRGSPFGDLVEDALLFPWAQRGSAPCPAGKNRSAPIAAS